MLAFAVVASGAPETKNPDCSDAGGCSVASDHSLLQAKINVHRVDDLEESNARACAYFGNCRANLTIDDARRTLLRVRSEQLGSDVNRLAFDCGSSGSNIAILTTTPSCQEFLDANTAIPPTFQTKNDPPTYTDCTVSKAFVGATPAISCSKWNNLETWVTQLPKCFGATECWAAGTAGNRLAAKTVDKTTWGNFKAWTKKIGLCSKWAKELHTSQSGSLTIPGAMEAAMEVETIIAREGAWNVGKTPRGIAFGSAGGSSAQFGICLTCWKEIKLPMVGGMPLPTTPAKHWQETLTSYGKKFQKANYPSEVDQVEGDYVNTYTASDGSKWAVGSFLGSDKCGPTGGTPSPITPMGGMAAMDCGIREMLVASDAAVAQLAANCLNQEKCPAMEEKMNQADTSTLLTLMQESGQGPLAARFKEMVTNYYGSQIRKGLSGKKEGVVRFIAKTFQVVGNLGPKQKYTGFNGEFTGKFANGKKAAYAYMQALGLLPSDVMPTMANQKGDIVTNEYYANAEQGSMQVDEYAWLDTAARIGFGIIPCKTGNCGFELSVKP